MSKKIVLAGACRTAIGKMGGALSNTPAADLGAIVIKEALNRAGVKPEQVDEVLMGCVIQAAQGQNRFVTPVAAALDLVDEMLRAAEIRRLLADSQTRDFADGEAHRGVHRRVNRDVRTRLAQGVVVRALKAGEAVGIHARHMQTGLVQKPCHAQHARAVGVVDRHVLGDDLAQLGEGFVALGTQRLRVGHAAAEQVRELLQIRVDLVVIERIRDVDVRAADALRQGLAAGDGAGVGRDVNGSLAQPLIVLVGLAVLNLHQAIARAADHFGQLAVLVQSEIAAEDRHALGVLFARADQAVKLAAHQLIGRQAALAHNGVHVAVGKVDVREAGAQLAVAHVEVAAGEVMHAAGVDEHGARRVGQLADDVADALDD